jgi:NitT/TauT family transport system substrate-binding protein
MSRFIIFLIIALTLAACGDGAAGPDGTASPAPDGPAAAQTSQTSAPLTPIRLPMGYIPDPQYAPLYVAADKGYFAEAGFEVEFDYSFETDGVALVGAGELPFALVSGEQVILARAQDLPVVYVLEWFQRYPIAIVSKSSAGITSPEQLRGRSVGLPGFFGASYVGYAGLLRAFDIAQEEVNASEIGFTQAEAIAADMVDAAVVYINNEPLQLQAQGYEVNVLPVADYSDLVANGIITNETMIAEQPEVVEAFLRAFLRGLADTLADPAGAYEICKKYVEGLDDSRRAVLDASMALWQTDRPGETDPGSWQQTQDVLTSIGFLDAPLADLEAAYTNEFVLAAREEN